MHANRSKVADGGRCPRRRRAHASRPRAGAIVHPGHRGDAPRPGPRRLDQLAAHPRRVGLQPPRPDRHRQRAPAPARVVVGPVVRGAARAEPAGLRRRALRRQSPRHRGGPRRRHRRAALALPARARGRRSHGHRHHPEPRHLRRQGLPDDGRRAHRRPRRAHRRRRVERRRGRPYPRVPLHGGAHRGPGERDCEHQRLRALPRGEGNALLHLGPGRAHRRRGVANVDGGAARRARGRHVGRHAAVVPHRRRQLDGRQLRPGHEPHLLGDGAGQAVGAVPAGPLGRRAVHEQRARPRPRHRQHRLVQPAPAGRDPRHGRDVREPPRRPRRAALALQDGQARDSLGARPHDRTVPRRPRSRVPDHPRRPSPRPARSPTAPA